MDLEKAIDHTLLVFKNKSILIRRDSWQAMTVSDRPEMVTHELVGHTLQAEMHSHTHVSYFQERVKPDLPWADDHFAERVSGEPLNPPPSEAWWPHAPQGNEAFKSDGIFSHTYPERFWPKTAGLAVDVPQHHGIRYPYGDLNDFINLLDKDPFTRQGFFPIFFPEDTGNVANVRIPCSIGYYMLLTGTRVDLTYYIRSCDLLRHFRNDIYFAIRFMLHVLGKMKHPMWRDVKPGIFRMHIGSLHCFRNDFYRLFGPKT